MFPPMYTDSGGGSPAAHTAAVSASASARTETRVQGIMPELFEKIAELHASLTPIQKNRLVNMLESSI